MTKSEYVCLHRKLRKQRGSAKLFNCVDCDRQAQEWSHIHETDPYNFSNYQPRCISCHRKYDFTEEMRTAMSLRRMENIFNLGKKDSELTKRRKKASAEIRWKIRAKQH